MRGFGMPAASSGRGQLAGRQLLDQARHRRGDGSSGALHVVLAAKRLQYPG
jgi:hypothetical protein